jgi:hypothetical protein
MHDAQQFGASLGAAVHAQLGNAERGVGYLQLLPSYGTRGIATREGLEGSFLCRYASGKMPGGHGARHAVCHFLIREQSRQQALTSLAQHPIQPLDLHEIHTNTDHGHVQTIYGMWEYKQNPTISAAIWQRNLDSTP